LKYGLVTFTALSSVSANTIIRFRFEEKWQTFESAKNDYDALISRAKYLFSTHRDINDKYNGRTKNEILHDDNAYLLSLEVKIHDDVENRLFVTSKGSSPRINEPFFKKELDEIHKILDEIKTVKQPSHGTQSETNNDQTDSIN
jgi:hypothetical protein